MKKLSFLLVIGILAICAAGMTEETTYEEILWCEDAPEVMETTCWGDYASCSWAADEQFNQCREMQSQWIQETCWFEFTSYCYDRCLWLELGPGGNQQSWEYCYNGCMQGAGTSIANCIIGHEMQAYLECLSARESFMLACVCP